MASIAPITKSITRAEIHHSEQLRSQHQDRPINFKQSGRLPGSGTRWLRAS
jgi:hypothetical protein